MAPFSLYSAIAPGVAVDLGTANTVVYLRGQGVRFSEPSYVAIDTTTDTIITVGEGAKQMVGRTPRHISVIRPMRNGVVSNFVYTEALVKQLLERAMRGRSLVPPIVIIGVPGSATAVERKAVREAALGAGAGRVHFVLQSVASAIGAGMKIGEPSASMIVEIGAGTTEVAVLSLGGLVLSESLKMGGDRLDEAVTAYLRVRRGFLVGEQSAEALKISHGFVGRPLGKPPAKVVGQDVRGRRPGTIEVFEEEVGSALAEPVGHMLDAIRSIVEQTPPELVRDLFDRGIVLAGGGAALAGLADTLREQLHVPVRVAEQPALCVAKGAGAILEDRRLFYALFPKEPTLIGRWCQFVLSGMREGSSSPSRS